MMHGQKNIKSTRSLQR